MISTRIIHEAIHYYDAVGYIPIDVPLTIDPDISAAARPPGRIDLPYLDKVYPASAEQSFLQLIREGTLKPTDFSKPGAIYRGRYQAITPCYRDEPVLDELHHKIFLKVELIVVGVNDAQKLIKSARSFFNYLGIDTGIKSEKDHLDLVAGGVELGSYGTRVFEGIPYVYGTGVAEPRTSFVLKKLYPEEKPIEYLNCCRICGGIPDSYTVSTPGFFGCELKCACGSTTGVNYGFRRREKAFSKWNALNEKE
jgi:hypothetical protein